MKKKNFVSKLNKSRRVIDSKIKRGRMEATIHRSKASKCKKALGETPTLPDERALEVP